MRLAPALRGPELLVDERHSSITIGRAEDNDVVVKGNLISRLHARIEINRNKFVLIDQSTNGTFVQSADGEESFVRRDSLQINGQGMIGLGRLPEQRLAADDPLHLRRGLRRPAARLARAAARWRRAQLACSAGGSRLPIVREIGADLGELLVPAARVDREQRRERLGRDVEPASVEILRPRQPADRRLGGAGPARAAIEHPGEHAQVLAESGPEELAVRRRGGTS